MEEKHTIIITVLNSVGVLARISGLLSQRGYNIESIIGAPTEDSDIYKISLVVIGTEEKIEQLTKQLNKLIDTIKVVDISHKHNYIIREYIIVKVNITSKNRSDIFRLIEVFSAKVLDITKNHIIMELSSGPRKIDRFIDLLTSHGIKEYIRSGEFAMAEI